MMKQAAVSPSSSPSSFLSMSSVRLVATVVCSMVAVPLVEPFSPCPPPRFDVFSDKLVRSWTTTTNDQETTKLTVEEVMRSCGGAVQGIREVPFDSQKNEESDDGLYLNRANDGFLFLDDGTYTCGPVQWKGEADLFLSNFCLSDTSRLLVTFNLNKSPEEEVSTTAPEGVFLRRTFGGGQDDSVPTIDLIDPLSISVDFSKHIQCSMPSTGQPWMLQRAKWEKEVNKDAENHQQQQRDLEDGSTSDSLQYWAISQPAAVFSEWSGISSRVVMEGHHVLHAGVFCEHSGRVQAIARAYNDEKSKSLKSVSFLDGSLRVP